MHPPGSPSSPAGAPPPALEIRPLRSHPELRACVALQRATWGEEFGECVPPAMLKVSQRIGGVTAGAFDAGGRLLGFIYGLTGVEGGRLVHWSHMLAVHPEARNLGLGRRLKEYQRERVRELGVQRIYWTYDPLVARNAHLNLNRLGARVQDYVENMYGESSSPLHQSGTDRFVVAWEVDAPAERSPARPGVPAGVGSAPVLNPGGGSGAADGQGAAVLRVEIPPDLDALADAAVARWRAASRAAFVPALADGYRVTGFYREDDGGPCYYVLTRPHDTRAEEGD